jgi:hypothetical protein
MTSSGTAPARASGTPVLGAVLGHIADLESVVGRGVAQMADALRSSIGFDLVVFTGFAVDAEAQERLATGKHRVGGSHDVVEVHDGHPFCVASACPRRMRRRASMSLGPS